MPSYTFTQKSSPSEPGQEDNFGGLAVDANHVGMTGVVGAGPQTVDISGTAIVSPATISSTAVTTINVPLNAAQVVFLAASNPVNVSESDNTVAGHYFTVPVGTQVIVDVARTAVLYLKGNGGSSTLSFYFNVV